MSKKSVTKGLAALSLGLLGHAANLREASAPVEFVGFNVWYPETVERQDWTQPPHILLIGQKLDQIRLGEIDRVRFTMPPRHAKTETVTIRGAVRDLLDHPEWNILITAYNQRYANRLSRKIRKLARQMGVRLEKGASAVDEWYTEAGGCVVARGVGSPPTGIGFHRIYIDDPVRNHKQIESETQRDDINDWYLTDVYQRREPGCAIILTMTQWHHYDLATVAVKAEPGRWVEVRLPAIAEANDLLGREPGEALWPERYDVAELANIKRTMSLEDGPRMFDALFQCNPYPADGGAIKREDFVIIDPSEVPKGLRLVRAYDVALSDSEKADETVGTLGGYHGKDLILVDQVAWQKDPADTVIRMMDYFTSDLRKWGSEEYAIERPLAGSVVMSLLDREVRASTLRRISVEVKGRKKMIRASAWFVKARRGQLKLVRGDWNEPFIAECLKFRGKNGERDNRVDSVSVLVEALAAREGNGNDKEKRGEPTEHSAEWFARVFENANGGKRKGARRRAQ